MNENNFLKENEDIRTSYLVVVATAATADRQNTPEELAFVEQMALAANLSDANRATVTQAVENAGSVDVASHIAKFKDNDLKFSLVTDLLNLSYSDGKLSDSEVAEIQKVTLALGISNEQFDALKQYVEASNKEASKEGGNPLITAEGQPKEQSGNFLEKIGLASVFQKLGIPTNNFASGATIAVTLTTAAYFLINSYMKSGNQPAAAQGQAQNATSPLMSFLGTALTGVMAAQTAQGGQQNPLMGMVAGLMSGQNGQNALGNVLGAVTQSFAQGQGMGNLMNIIGGLATATQGNQNQQAQAQPQNQLANNITNLLGSFFK